MSRHDLVSAQISNVCVTRHAALNAIAYTVCVKQFVMSLPASNFLGVVVQWEQKGWDRGRWVGIYTQRVKTQGRQGRGGWGGPSRPTFRGKIWVPRLTSTLR